MTRGIFPNQNPSTPATDIYIKDSGTWKAAKNIWVKQSGSWVQVWPRQADWLVSGAEFYTNYNYGSSAGGFFLSVDGTKIFVTDSSNNNLYQYTLGTAWDISTATLAYTFNLGVTTQKNVATSIWFRPDGLRLFVRFTSGYVYRWTLGTAYTISSAGASTGKLFTDYATDYFFSYDGLNMYGVVPSLYDYTITSHAQVNSAWDLQGFTAAPTATSPAFTSYNRCGTIKDNGQQIFPAATYVYTLNLSTGNDVTTATNPNIKYYPGASVSAIRFRPDGKFMYLLTNGLITMYRLNT